MAYRKIISLRLILLTCCILTCLSTPNLQAQENSKSKTMGGIDLTGMVVFNRQIDKLFQTRKNPSLFVSHKFGGAIRISTWDNPAIKLKAIVKVGAKNMTLAKNFAESISIEAIQEGNRLELRSLLPDKQASATIGGYVVELYITVPSSTLVVAENTFGDCYIDGVKQDVSVDVSFGGVYLSDIQGKVNVRAKGEYPLFATGLPQGGAFFLRGTQSHFSKVGGQLSVQSYLGTVTIEQLLEEADVSVTSDSGHIVFTQT